jgi:hypothetical protein
VEKANRAKKEARATARQDGAKEDASERSEHDILRAGGSPVDCKTVELEAVE